MSWIIASSSSTRSWNIQANAAIWLASARHQSSPASRASAIEASAVPTAPAGSGKICNVASTSRALAAVECSPSDCAIASASSACGMAASNEPAYAAR